MPDTSLQHPGQPDMLSHQAYVTHDVEATVEFYEKIMGMPLVDSVIGDKVPSTGDDFPYFHIFFRQGDGSTIAFFERRACPRPTPRATPRTTSSTIWRCRSTANWAARHPSPPCAVSVPSRSPQGKAQRRRLNRGGDRQANAALHRIVVTRMRQDERTRLYLERRTAEGKGKGEVMRCLKRYVAREVYN
ncbi:hypothetical protein SALBM311S_11703 [Streptomyces alboniger]